MVGGGQDRALSQARKARAAHDRLEGRGHPQAHREGGVDRGEAVRLPPRQTPSQLHDQRACAPSSGRTSTRSVDGSRPDSRPLDAKRPLLVHGADFRAFMKAREPIKQRCQPGEFYCLGCRAPKRPALDMADYRPRTPSARLAERHLSRLRTDDLSGGNARQTRPNQRRARRRISDGGATHRR